MPALYGRKVELVVSAPNAPPLVKAAWNDTPGVDLSGLDIDFSVERTLKPEPNNASIRVYNLSDATRKAVSGAKTLNVSLAAGYQSGVEQIYFGQVRAAWTERQGPDFITHFESGDGEQAKLARLNTGVGGRVPIGTALSMIVQALGLGPGNVAKVQSALAKTGVTAINGGALTGNASRRMTDFCRSAGLEWSIQNGVIQILEQGSLLSPSAVLVSTATGMIESPTVDSKGIVTATMLITQGLVPGCLVSIDSLFFQGGYRVQRCRWQASTSGTEWNVTFDGKKY